MAESRIAHTQSVRGDSCVLCNLVSFTAIAVARGYSPESEGEPPDKNVGSYSVSKNSVFYICIMFLGKFV